MPTPSSPLPPTAESDDEDEFGKLLRRLPPSPPMPHEASPLARELHEQCMKYANKTASDNQGDLMQECVIRLLPARGVMCNLMLETPFDDALFCRAAQSLLAMLSVMRTVDKLSKPEYDDGSVFLNEAAQYICQRVITTLLADWAEKAQTGGQTAMHVLEYVTLHNADEDRLSAESVEVIIATVNDYFGTGADGVSLHDALGPQERYSASFVASVIRGLHANPRIAPRQFFKVIGDAVAEQRFDVAVAAIEDEAKKARHVASAKRCVLEHVAQLSIWLEDDTDLAMMAACVRRCCVDAWIFINLEQSWRPMSGPLGGMTPAEAPKLKQFLRHLLATGNTAELRLAGRYASPMVRGPFTEVTSTCDSLEKMFLHLAQLSCLEGIDTVQIARPDRLSALAALRQLQQRIDAALQADGVLQHDGQLYADLESALVKAFRNEDAP